MQQSSLEFYCFLLAIPQTIQAIVQLASSASGGGKVTNKKRRLGLVFWLAVIGLCSPVILGLYVHFNPLKPEVKTITIEKTLPCPPSKSGAATTRGQQSPAITGSNNPVTYGDSSSPKKQ